MEFFKILKQALQGVLQKSVSNFEGQYPTFSFNKNHQLCAEIMHTLSIMHTLTHFSPVSHFYTLWKRQFSGGIEMWHWSKMG